MEPNRTTTTEADELLRAELDVQQTRAELARSLRQASKTSENLLRRVQDELKPSLVVGAVLVGAVAVAGVAVALSRRSRQRSWFTPRQPSTLGVVAKAVGLWALRLAARRAAQEVVARLEQPQRAPGAAASAAQ